MLICSNAKLVCFPYVCIPLLCLLEYWNKSNLKNLKRVNLCLAAIQNVTARKLSVHTIQ